jgi:hypothetical protein
VAIGRPTSRKREKAVDLQHPQAIFKFKKANGLEKMGRPQKEDYETLAIGRW